MHTSEISITVGAHYNDLGLGNNKCKAGIEKAVIRPDGFVFPCVGMKKVEEFMDCNNIRSNSLEYIINESHGFRLLRQILAAGMIKDFQQDGNVCKFNNYCIAQNISEFQLNNQRLSEKCKKRCDFNTDCIIQHLLES